MSEATQRTMPEQLGFVFEDLRGHVMFLHMKWKVYRDFYQSQESLDVINELVPGVFNVLEHTLRTDIIITLCRLTDPITTGKKQNLTIDRLLADVQPLAPDWLNDRLRQIHTKLQAQVKPVRELRNRVVGHNDYRTALSTHPDPPTATHPSALLALCRPAGGTAQRNRSALHGG